MGLDYSFVEKNKHVKKNIAASMENVAGAVDKNLDNEKIYILIFFNGLHI